MIQRILFLTFAFISISHATNLYGLRQLSPEAFREGGFYASACSGAIERIVTQETFAAALTELEQMLDAQGIPPEAGVLGPNSLTWQILRQNAIFGGAPLAVLLQLAMPEVSQAIGRSKKALEDPIGRFQGTFGATIPMIFGTRAEAFDMAHRVFKIHAKVFGENRYRQGSEPEQYHANRVGSLLRVWATSVWSVVEYVDTIGLDHFSLTPHFRAMDSEKLWDQYIREQHNLALLFGIPKELLPRGWAELDAYITKEIQNSNLRVTDLGRRIGLNLLRTPLPRSSRGWASVINPNTVIRGNLRELEQLTVALLPGSLAHDYGLDPLSDDERMRAIENIRRYARYSSQLPDVARFNPVYLAALERLGLSQPRGAVAGYFHGLFSRQALQLFQRRGH